MIKSMICALLLIFMPSVAASSQDSGPIRCAVTLYRFHGDDGKLIKSLEFIPTMGEEELTSKSLRLPGSPLYLIASVFPTDESMHSAKGADSLRLALAKSRDSKISAFDLSNNAVAEVTLNTFDTARVERRIGSGRQQVLARLECWDSALEKK